MRARCAPHGPSDESPIARSVLFCNIEKCDRRDRWAIKTTMENIQLYVVHWPQVPRSFVRVVFVEYIKCHISKYHTIAGVSPMRLNKLLVEETVRNKKNYCARLCCFFVPPIAKLTWLSLGFK